MLDVVSESSPNGIATVRRYIEAFNRRDLDAAVATVHPEARIGPELHYALPGAAFHGRAGAHGLLKGIFAESPSLRLETQGIRQVGNRLLVNWRLRESPESGLPSTRELVGLFGISGGQIVRYEAFTCERAALEAAERPDEPELRLLIQGASVPIVLLDGAGHFIEANAAACDLYGVDSDELRGRAMVDFVPPASAGRLRALLQHAWAHEDVIDEIPVLSAGGELHPAVELRIRRDHVSDHQMAILIARDEGPRTGASAPCLTPREREVFSLLAEGFTAPAIADRLAIAPDTVRTHVRNAMGKLEANTRVQAVSLALARGEIGRSASGPQTAA